jgi:transposase
MISLGATTRIIVATEPVDLRRGHDGLVTLVRSLWKEDPYCGALFVFFGRRSDRIKILFFSTGGFVVYYKRLEQGRFRLPEVPDGAERIVLTSGDLSMLLDGVDLRSVTRLRAWSPLSKKNT